MIQSKRHPRHGFTLIEVLVAVGIIVLLTALAIPAILVAKKKGTEARIKSDLGMIANAIEAYKNDFNGQYPQFADPMTDAYADTAGIQGSGKWLDEQSSGVRGAVLLCRALVGPGPANTSTNSPGYPPNPGDDGYDGPGFRMRINISGTTANGPILNGKSYGPYLDGSKFRVQYLVPKNNTVVGSFPKAFPALFEGVGGDWTDPQTGQAYSGSPILYYPAAPGNPPQSLGYGDPPTIAGSGNGIQFRFNGYDNQYFLDATSGGSTFPNTSSFSQLAANCGSPQYLLWTAGVDGQFGLINGKSDDLTNFDLPANLKK